jgi:hypothetical protein
MAMRYWIPFVVAGLSLLIAANAVGYYVGRLDTPPYNKETAAYFIMHYAKLEPRSDHQLRVIAGEMGYEYDLVSRQVFPFNPPLPEMYRRSKARHYIDELRSVYSVVGSASLAASILATKASLERVSELPPRSSKYTNRRDVILQRYANVGKWSVATLSAVIGYIGYRIGYNDPQSYSESDFRSAMQDASIWEYATLNLNICRSLWALEQRNIQVAESYLPIYDTLPGNSTIFSDMMEIAALVSAELAVYEADALLDSGATGERLTSKEFHRILEIREEYQEACADIVSFWSNDRPSFLANLNRAIDCHLVGAPVGLCR